MLRSASFFTALAFLGLAALPLLWAVPNPLGERWLAEVHNAGHVPLFSLLQALCLWWGSRFVNSRRSLVGLLILSSCLLLVVGGIIELLQPFIQRTASWSDFSHDLLGIAAGTSAFLVLRYLPGLWLKTSAATVVIGLSLVIALWPAWPWIFAKWRIERSFPTIMKADMKAAARHLRGIQGGLTSNTSPPPQWRTADEVIRVTLPANGRMPGLVMDNPHSNWTGFDQLAFKVYALEPSRMRVRIVSGTSDTLHDASQMVNIVPGENPVVLELKNFPGINFSEVRAIAWQMVKLTSPTELFLDDIQLQHRSDLSHLKAPSLEQESLNPRASGTQLFARHGTTWVKPESTSG